MDTIQIIETIKRLPCLQRIFIGVFPIDKMNKVEMNGKWACIINTAPSTHKGEHWVAAIRISKIPEYFDSYGLPPRNEIHEKISRHYNKYKYNKVQVQRGFATTCGAHCIYFLYRRVKGDAMETITKRVTDKKVDEFVHTYYSPDEETEEECHYVFQNGK